MAITFPTTLDTLSNPTSTDLLENATAALDHDVQHSNANDAIEALEAKVGADSSAVTTSHDYKLSGVTGSDKAVSKTGTETLTNKTLTSPVINVGSDATGDIWYRNAGGLFTRLAAGATDTILAIQSGIPAWISNPSASDSSYSVKGIVRFLTDAATSGITVASGIANVNTGTGANQIVKRDSSGNYPSGDGSAITNLTLLPKTIISTLFEDTGRFTETVTNTASATYNTIGVALAAGGGVNGSINVTAQINVAGGDVFAGSPMFGCTISIGDQDTLGGTGHSFFGVGVVTVATAGITYTPRHVGFKFIKTGGVMSLYATQADGSTENASSALTTVAQGDSLDLLFRINSTTSVDYYYRKNGGALSSATNLTSNLPSGTVTDMQFAASSVSTASVNTISVHAASYQR